MHGYKSMGALPILVIMLTAPSYASSSDLVDAVMNDDFAAAQDLIRKNVQIDQRDAYGSTALQWAIYNENYEIADLLVGEAGAELDLANREGMTPLVLAAETGNAAIVSLLLKAGANLEKDIAGGVRPLMMAARTGNVKTINLLLDHGADIDAREALRGTTALMWAAAYRNDEAVVALLARGANPNLRSALQAPGREPYIAPSARERIRDYYFETGPNGAQVEFDKSVFGENDEINAAPERAALVRLMPKELIAAFEKEKLDLTSKISMPQQRKNWGGLSPLHFAVREGSLDTVVALVQGGADINGKSEYGWTPLLIATHNRYYQIGKYLLEKGADPNRSNEGGWNPLYIATDNRNIEGGDYPTRKPDLEHLEFIKILLDAGADPNLRMRSSTETRTIFTHQWLDEDGATPFLRASQSSDVALMQLFLDRGADPGISTADGVTPLMLASGIAWVEGVTFEWSEEANRQAIEWLLDLGNDPNAQDAVDRRSALMGAAHKGRNYAVKMLVDAGANLEARDIGSRDSMGARTGVTWQAIDYAEGLVRIGVQSAVPNPHTAKLIREMMQAKGLEVPPEGRTLESICIVEICK